MTYDSLIAFEQDRSAKQFIPPLGSNSFYTIGNGEINLKTLKDDPNNYRFDLYTNDGTIHTGDGTFYVSGNIYDVQRPYDRMTIIQNTELVIDQRLDISKGSLYAHGRITLSPDASMIATDHATLTLYPDSELFLQDGCSIRLDTTATMKIYGTVHVPISLVDQILNGVGITLDPAAVVDVYGIDTTNRCMALTDYESKLRSEMLNVHTQSDLTTPFGRMGYTWTGGDPLQSSQVIQLSALQGDVVLGDFKLSVLGQQTTPIANSQIVSNLVVREEATLFITESFHDGTYIRPELYLGIVISNHTQPGNCIVRGNLMVDGPNATITLDRGGSLFIESGATCVLQNQATITSSNNAQERVLIIYGTLIIDTLDQLIGFDACNIYIGDSGKLIIRNPDTGERRVVLSIPDGIQTSELYRLFGTCLNRVEFHISNRTGIRLDRSMEFYGRDLINWYNGCRIEKAIHEGWIVWHAGGFIELDQTVVPWVTSASSLIDAASLFKSTESAGTAQLQDVANRLMYAGAEDMVFVFLHGTGSHEVTLHLQKPHMQSTYHFPGTDTYRVNTDTDGELFLRNNLPNLKMEQIIHPEAVVTHANGGETIFSL